MQPVSPLINFLHETCPPLLNVSREDVLREITNSEKTLRKFLFDSGTNVLIVGKESLPMKEEDGDVPKYQLFVTTENKMRQRQSHSLAFVKRWPGPLLNSDEDGATDRNMSDLIQVSNLEFLDGNNLDLLKSYLQNVTQLLVGSKPESTEESMIPEVNPQAVGTIQRKLADLVVSVENAQQSVAIPLVKLEIDPVIAKLVEEAKKESRKVTQDDMTEQLADTVYLNHLQHQVGDWSKKIQKLTGINRQATSGGALEEIGYWSGMERALHHVKEQLNSPEAETMLSALRWGKRYMATYSFSADDQLTKLIETVASVNVLMKDFPIQDLLTSSTPDQIKNALLSIFVALRKIKNASSYPLNRAFLFVEAISRDLMNALQRILKSTNLIDRPYKESEYLLSQLQEIFVLWDDESRKFKDICRELVKKRGNQTSMMLPPKLQCHHTAIQERLEDIRKVRTQHEKLKDVVSKTLSEGKAPESMTHREITSAFKVFATVDCNDVTPAGVEQWHSAKKAYDTKIDNAEAQIIKKLRESLDSARSANEMFQVFAKCNALFFRPRIRGAIQEFQSTLVEEVNRNIKDLQKKFKSQYIQSNSYRAAKARDMPVTSGSMIWMKQLERHLNVSIQRIQDVLGEGWEAHVEGQKILSDGESFQKKLNLVPYFEHWLHTSKQLTKMDAFSKVLQVVQLGGRHVELDVNGDWAALTFFKDARFMQSITLKATLQIMKIPYSMKVFSDETKSLYPFVSNLKDAVRGFTQACLKLEDPNTAAIAPLIAIFRQEAYKVVEEGFVLTWDSDVLETYTRKFHDKVSILEQKMEDAQESYSKIKTLMEQIKKLPISGSNEPVLEFVKKIQTIVEELNNGNYSLLITWVLWLDQQLEKILAERIDQTVSLWMMDFKKYTGESVLIQNPLVLEFRIHHHKLILSPTLERAREYWMKNLGHHISSIVSLPKIIDSIRPSSPEQTAASFAKTLNMELLSKAYGYIEGSMESLKNHLETWMHYQIFWEVNVSDVVSSFCNNLSMWQDLLNKIIVAKKTFDSIEDQINFGPLIIDHSKIQQKLHAKLDFWVRDVTGAFALTVNSKSSELIEEVEKTQEGLQNMFDSTKGFLPNFNSMGSQEKAESIAQLSKFVTQLTAGSQIEKQYQADVEYVVAGERLLQKQKYNFGSSWIWAERVLGIWETFQQLLRHHQTNLERQQNITTKAIVAYDKNVQEQLQELQKEWQVQKPVHGSGDPDETIAQLKKFEIRLKKLADTDKNLKESKTILGIEDSIQMQKDRVDSSRLGDEIECLLGVWNEMHKLEKGVHELKRIRWKEVIIKQVKSTLEQNVESIKTIPAKFKQYEAFELTRNNFEKMLKSLPFLSELQSDSVKERHWRKILDEMNIGVSYNDLTLEYIWNAHNETTETAVREILVQAQGEMALEEFLRIVKDLWSEYSLMLVSFKNRTSLVKDWDALFALLDDHLSSLHSMKMSPYAKIFEEDASLLEEKLNRIRSIFEALQEVQRKWLYLEGVFTGSSDIQSLLPTEFAKFKQADTDFLSIMKKTSQKPRVLDVIAIDGLQKQLTRVGDLLTKIQKALGEYLEKQRSKFPRFYFVGDEDLLEMIGAAKDVLTVQRHLSKMFSGIAGLLTSDSEGKIVSGMASAEGEEVQFTKPVIIEESPSLNEWLRKIEEAMFATLAQKLSQSMENITKMDLTNQDSLLDWMRQFPAQVLVLSVQVKWTSDVERCLKDTKNSSSLNSVRTVCANFLASLSTITLTIRDPNIIQKVVQIITEVVFQRDVIDKLTQKKVSSIKDFTWLENLRLVYDSKVEDCRKRLSVKISNCSFLYGFEYLGVGEKLVRTPLTNKTYRTLAQALHMRLGGNPFGPAGTGKTETVKAFGQSLGRFVLVFCCDESFDYKAMCRIFIGLCQVGAWGCFDEFNRLEENILSAVSEQILTIQKALQENFAEISLDGHPVQLHENVGIFVTMNPGYAGRSNLPDNLKQLFREIAMIVPDKVNITEVLLLGQGFKTAHMLASKVVALFDLCEQQLSKQQHYAFGLRSLKSVFSSAGNLQREAIAEGQSPTPENELSVLLRSICDTMVPKLVAKDVPLLGSLLSGVFPGAELLAFEEIAIENAIRDVCHSHYLYPVTSWVDKILQLHKIMKLHHGVMIVGSVGTGKTSAWKTLFEATEHVTGKKGTRYIIDPKTVSKEHLFGKLDSTTLEWTDGIFTFILRKINASPKVDDTFHWIVFDGDVDPSWAENLNSLLDDNKILTLPNAERLQLPSNVRIMFEVDSLKWATLATVSRVGMVWFSQDILPRKYYLQHFQTQLRTSFQEAPSAPLDLGATLTRSATNANLPDEIRTRSRHASILIEEDELQHKLLTTKNSMMGGLMEVKPSLYVTCADILEPYLSSDGLLMRCLHKVGSYDHIMVFTEVKAIDSFLSLMKRSIKSIIETSPSNSLLRRYLPRQTLFAICWGLGGSLSLSLRQSFCTEVANLASNSIDLPSDLEGDKTLLDYFPSPQTGEWHRWLEEVEQIHIEPSKVLDANLVIETTDTARHRSVLDSWLDEEKTFLLCGPPGSGKSMTLLSALKSRPDFVVASLNFSSGSTPELLLKTFDHYCEYVKTTTGTILRPSQASKKLIIFCDEINLPAPDAHGTQRVISFIRQISESRGFWRYDNEHWNFVRVERIQFAGACNPPTDAGRHPMSDRFLRHAPLMFVDFPATESLRQIYGTFSRAMLNPFPSLKDHASSLTELMVSFYKESQNYFTIEMQPHYIYSPRELTRWKVAICEVIQSEVELDLNQLVRLAMHEGLRIFQDRLVRQEEKDWTDEMLNSCVSSNFPSLSKTVLRRPLLFSPLLRGIYEEVDRQELRDFSETRIRTFNEEEVNVQLVLFDAVLDHITRIDRVLRQPLGHLLLVGPSGAGKTVLPRLVSWINGLSVFQIKAGRNYNTVAFEQDLRTVMKRCAVKNERITFIFDESNAMGPAFLERMNALLASGEVPGLFEGDDYSQLLSECRAAWSDKGTVDETEVFQQFTKKVQRNLHIVFTMNPSNPDFSNRQATSPALFNRCVIDWYGDWPEDALLQVATEFTQRLELVDDYFEQDSPMLGSQESKRAALARAVVDMHFMVVGLNQHLNRTGKRGNYSSPRDYLDFIRHFVKLIDEVKAKSAEDLRHLSVGLQKLRETEEAVGEMQQSLAIKKQQLTEKDAEANEKMQLMVQQKTATEEKKKEVESLAKELAQQSEVITIRTADVQEQLHTVEPLLNAAQKAVGAIEKKFLDELKAMSKPPRLVQRTMESVVVMLNNMGDNNITWEDCRRVLKQTDFINRVVKFDSSTTSAATVNCLQKKYLESPEWDIEKILNASAAAGPLATWVSSSLQFQIIMQKVEPLRQEIQQLQKAQTANAAKLTETEDLIKELQAKAEDYKVEYATLIGETENIKKEMTQVANRVDRSQRLLTSLGAEKSRWEKTAENSTIRTHTVVGDSLLSGAFCTFLGFYAYGDRDRLKSQWIEVLEENFIRFQAELSFSEFLSTPSEKHRWHTSAGLASDSLSVENAIILRRYIRYPLIIDPAGQATSFISDLYQDKKIVKASFSDPGFYKQLETCLRFGTPLIVQDVHKVDPVLNSVLNQETYKSGGRVLITVGDTEIDFSPAFTMFLVTQNPTAHFTPDLSSRVTFVNFTLTPSSLLYQNLHLVLKSERPDVDKKRLHMLKLQSEYRIQLRDLEDSLLYSLSTSTGNLLEDDAVISSLESLKAQAQQLETESAKTEEMMQDVEKVSRMYVPFAEAGARLFFTISHLNELHYLYHYDLRFFDFIYAKTLFDPAIQQIEDKDSRLKLLFSTFFKNFYQETSHSLVFKHRLPFALQLARIFYESVHQESFDCEELKILCQVSKSIKSPDIGTILVKGIETLENSVFKDRLTIDQKKGLQNIMQLEFFEILPSVMIKENATWFKWLEETTPETCFPIPFTTNNVQDSYIAEKDGDLRAALLLLALRPDRLPNFLNIFVEKIIAEGFTFVPEFGAQEIESILGSSTSSSVPTLMTADVGVDPSPLIMNAAKNRREQVTSIAIGTEDSNKAAEKAIDEAAQKGRWILMKNIHLSPNWLVEIERKLRRQNPHENFRLFMTSEFNEQVPSSLIRMSNKLAFESPAGIKASLQRTYARSYSLNENLEKKPVSARLRLHFLLSFLHAVCLERKRYMPIGWSKKYEFSDSDFHCSFDVIEEWIQLVSEGSDVLDPQSIPFEAIKTILGEAGYGGRLDSDVDNKVLRTFLDHLFSSNAFESNFQLTVMDAKISGAAPLVIPDISGKVGSYTKWIENLPATDDPRWLGFSPNAERLLSSRHAADSLDAWQILHMSSAEELHELIPEARQNSIKATTPSKRRSSRRSLIDASNLTRLPSSHGWLSNLIPVITSSLDSFPKNLPEIQKPDSENPMLRLFHAETKEINLILEHIKEELHSLLLVCQGKAKFTNDLRHLAQFLSTGKMPSSWHLASASQYSKTLTLSIWMTEFVLRLRHQGAIIKSINQDGHADSFFSLPFVKSLSTYNVWAGGLFNPHSFLTATRQVVSKKEKISLDDLQMKIRISPKDQNNDSWYFYKVTLEGATWSTEQACLKHTSVLYEELQAIEISWASKLEALHGRDGKKIISVPLFADQSRTDIISMVDVAVDASVPEDTWYQRAVGIVLWRP
eukprot:GHVP01016658.1.p1 GENE.GHVP01016658.1~~GHVP01016658.1.p1  ORF type:complete len:4656 (-),score=837.71 GHVP01016658.1:4666-18633(-)